MRHLKHEFDKLTFRESLLYLLALFCQIAAITAIFMGIFLDPRGEVHASILTYFGISCGFCGSILGISTHYSSELSKFKAGVAESLQSKQA